MKENKITFFEEINFWSSERMHSEIIHWILSGNCSWIKGDNLKKIYKDFLEIEINDKKDIIFSGNEINKFDIFIKTKKNIIVIENKLKSSEHSNQLDRYLEKKDLCLEEEDKYKEKNFFSYTYKRRSKC